MDIKVTIAKFIEIESGCGRLAAKKEGAGDPPVLSDRVLVA